jgi:hypothetical protein
MLSFTSHSLLIWVVVSVYLSIHTTNTLMGVLYICAVYSNTLLATLNARQSIRNTLDNTTISLSGLKQGATSMGNSQVNSRRIFVFARALMDMILQRRSNNIAIKVDTTQEYSEERQYSDGEVHNTPLFDRIPTYTISQFLDTNNRKIGGTIV